MARRVSVLAVSMRVTRDAGQLSWYLVTNARMLLASNGAVTSWSRSC